MPISLPAVKRLRQFGVIWEIFVGDPHGPLAQKLVSRVYNTFFKGGGGWDYLEYGTGWIQATNGMVDQRAVFVNVQPQVVFQRDPGRE